MPLSPWTSRGCRRTMRRISHMESLIFPFQGESKEKVLLYRIKKTLVDYVLRTNNTGPEQSHPRDVCVFHART